MPTAACSAVNSRTRHGPCARTDGAPLFQQGLIGCPSQLAPSHPTRYTGGLLISNLSSRLLLPLSQGEAVLHASDLWHAVSVPTGERWSWVVWFRTCPHCSLAGAADWYRSRAEAGGDAMAMYLHARRIAPPRTGLPAASAARAAGWLRASAELGFGPAAHQLGLAHATGHGVPVDLRIAAVWLARAAGVEVSEWACGGWRAAGRRAVAGPAGREDASVGLVAGGDVAAGIPAVAPASAYQTSDAPLAGGPSAASRAGVDLARLLLRAVEMGWPSPLGTCPEQQAVAPNSSALAVPDAAVLLSAREADGRNGDMREACTAGAPHAAGAEDGCAELAAPVEGRGGGCSRPECARGVEGAGGGGWRPRSGGTGRDIGGDGSGAAESPDSAAAEGASDAQALALALLRRAAAEGHAWARQRLGEVEAES